MQPFIVPLEAPEAATADRFGPKAANLATLAQAGLPTPGGYALDAAAYRSQLAAVDPDGHARGAFATQDKGASLRHVLAVRLAIMENPIIPEVREPLLAAWRTLVAATGTPIAVRSSALVEDRFGSSFAGQFESFLDIETEEDFLIAVRACWAALWSTRALRYMAMRSLDPADTAMALIIQPLVKARAAGGALTQTAEGGMMINAAAGLGSLVAQGEVTPDRYELTREGKLQHSQAGTSAVHLAGCTHKPARAAALPRLDGCLTPAQAEQLGALMLRAEALTDGPVEIEWALDEAGLKLLQSRPLIIDDSPLQMPDEEWLGQPKLRGQPAGAGWATGIARVVSCECEMERLGPGDILVTKMAGPALGRVLSMCAGVVTELGGSTSHLASLARERCVPMVLGVPGATLQIPEGSVVAVDGVAGIVRWMRNPNAPVVQTDSRTQEPVL